MESRLRYPNRTHLHHRCQMLCWTEDLMSISLISTLKSARGRKKKYLKRDKQVPLKCQSVGDILKDASQVASLRLFNLLYCKYLIPPRCLLAISGRINRRGTRQKGQNEYLRLSDMSPPAFSLHLDVAGLTHRATWNNIVTSTMFAGKSDLVGS